MEKRNFFEELYELDRPDSSREDFDNVLASLKANRRPRLLSRSSGLSSIRGGTRMPHQIQRLARTVSAPLALTSKPKASLTEPSLDTPTMTAVTDASESPIIKTSDLQPPAVGRSRTGKGEKPLKMPSVGKRKRKRGQSLEILPESQQIFQGLRFCKLPSNASF